MLIARMLLILLVAAGVGAVAGGPVFYVEQPEVDLGDCDYLDPVYHRFIVTNTGDRTLRFDVAKRSCGCVSEVVSRNIVPPGAASEVVVCYMPSAETGLHGPESFAVWLSTNDPARKMVELSVRAHLRRPVECDPSRLDFGAVEPGSTVRRPLRVICFGNEEVPALENVEASSKKLAISKASEMHAGKVRETTFEILWNLPAEPRRFNEVVFIRTDSPRRPLIEVPVKGEARRPDP